jgi:hypothetical protein
VRDSGSNHRDFLTGVTIPTKHRIAPRYKNIFPRDANRVLTAYEKSDIKSKIIKECKRYLITDKATENIAIFKEIAARKKQKGIPERLPITANFLT